MFHVKRSLAPPAEQAATRPYIETLALVGDMFHVKHRPGMVTAPLVERAAKPPYRDPMGISAMST
jgi:hypothetical protein